ncbi:MAG TPA: amidase [Candidatus Binataceae bacterium]|nr:amidase [Candidatus Binataceae bacterium]
MKATELASLNIGEAAELIRKKSVSPVEITRACLEQVERHDRRLHGYITVLADSAMSEARHAEQSIARGEYLGPLHGIPLALKDTFAMRGVRVTAGSKLLEKNVLDYDSAVIERLRKAGVVFLGTLNMHEFAFGATTANPFYGVARNPWDQERIPGGSSGGSAVAVAASMCLGSIGTDAGGSVRLPASLCGIVGLKPTFGRISRFGTLPLSLTMDHNGPMTKTVADAAIILDAVAGPDPRDPGCSARPVSRYREELASDIKGLKIGLPKEYFAEAMDPEVRSAVIAAVQKLASLGAVVEEVSLPHCKYAPPTFVALAMSEAASVHARDFRSKPGEYSPELRDLLSMGLLIPGRRYLQAQRVRTMIVRDLAAALRQVSVIVMPTSTIPAPRIGERSTTLNGKTVNVLAALTRLTSLFNLTGLPTVSIPCGFTAAGLPIGMQIAGKPFAETTVLRVAHAYETNSEWKDRRPAL